MAKTKKPTQRRADGWRNIYTGLGTKRDKRGGAGFVADRLDEVTAEELWRGDDIAARIIESQPDAELRQGFSVVVSDASSDGPPPPQPRIDAKDGDAKDGAELAQQLMHT